MKFEHNFASIDIETGGLSSEKNPVTEIAIIIIDNDLNEIGEYSQIIIPYGNFEIQQQTLDCSNMTLDLLNTGKDGSIVVKECCDFLFKHKIGKNMPVFVGHNSDKFDIPFIANFFDFFKTDLTKYINPDFTIDTMWWSRLRWKESSNYKLGTCCQNAGVELSQAHRALNDARATSELFKYFMRSLRSDSSVVENQTKKFRTTFQF